MYITKLEMTGFKSFASRLGLEFRHGIMAVVGPNGCGKTNIVDAIRWVLGEQRTGVLRAERMESVIFNGTHKKRPLSMAEVTLTIDNDKGFLPSPYTEVAITRRLFRSGESEYLINRNPSRLRDINDMFIDTGFGNSAYSIIELSMVEAIITGPSDMRRQIIEEAAGVARYKERRQAAIRRLESTRENLSRIEDIYIEVEKQYRSLKRQASRAHRYQKLTEAIRYRLLADLSEERLNILHQKEPLETRLTELDSEGQRTEAEAARLTSDLLSLEGRELSNNDKIKRAQDSLKRLERREAETDRDNALVKQRRKFLEAEAKEAGERRRDLALKIKTTENRIASTHKEVEGLRKKLEEHELKHSEVEGSAGSSSTDIEALRQKTKTARIAEDEVRHKLATITEHEQRQESEKERMKDQFNLLAKRSEEIKAELGMIESDLSGAHHNYKTVLSNAKNASTALDKAVAALNIARQDHSQALTEHAEVAAAAEAAKSELQIHRSRSCAPAILPKALSKVVEEKRLRTVAERIDCRKEHRVAVATVLGSFLDALDSSSLKDALEIVQVMDENQQAALRFPVDASYDREEIQLPTGAKSCIAGKNLVNNEDEFGRFLQRSLYNVLLTPDVETMARLASWAAEKNIRLVTLEGTLLEPEGILRAGTVDPEALLVGWLSRLHELEKKVSESEAALATTRENVILTRKKLAEAETGSEKARDARLKMEDETAACKRQIASLENEGNRLRDLGNTLTTESDKVKQEIARLQDDTDSINGAGKLKNALNDCIKQRLAAEEELHRLEQQRLEIAEQRASIAAETARLSERLSATEKALEILEREAQSTHNELASLDAQLAEGVAELKRVKATSENIKAQIELLKREKDDLDSNLDLIHTERKELNDNHKQANLSLNDTRERQRSALKEYSRCETEVIMLRERLREVDRRLTEDACINPDHVTDSSHDDALAELEALDLSDTSLERMKARLQSIGPVNMLALEEIKDVEERYRFLSDQKADLENGMEVLEETIDRINMEARRIFRETFNKVNINFQAIFRDLFEGGEAQLTLQEGDPLEAEIRIWATPSEKKLQGLAMLSGGEKALTAIALLFAIYRVRPSPFCILDEVDAPLDDANIIRFNNLIRQYALETQFMIVTHNKMTMEAADCLFGVTLGQDGTSKMVSVKIEGRDDSIDTGESDETNN